jgi:hypothetical protein
MPLLYGAILLPNGGIWLPYGSNPVHMASIQDTHLPNGPICLPYGSHTGTWLPYQHAATFIVTACAEKSYTAVDVTTATVCSKITITNIVSGIIRPL